MGPDLARLGDEIVSVVDDLHHQCEHEPPRLSQYDAWGRRVDMLHTCAAWKEQKRISAREGLIAIAYQRELSQYRYLLFPLLLFPSTKLTIQQHWPPRIFYVEDLIIFGYWILGYILCKLSISHCAW